EVLHIRMGRRAIQVIIILLDVLAMITLPIGQPECPLLEYRVLAVPSRQRKTQPLAIVAETSEAVLAPVISTRAGLIVAEIIPRVPIGAVVLAHSAPLAFAEVWPPQPPQHAVLPRFVQPQRLRRLPRFDRRRLGHDAPHQVMISQDINSR